MSAKFKLDGSNVDRLTYVKKHLAELLQEELKPSQYFNVIQFASKVSKFSSKNVRATKANIKVFFKIINCLHYQKALAFINKFRASGGTNAKAALQQAFKEKRLDAIYFLSDGQPSTSPASIINMVKAENKKRKRKVKIHATSFLKGKYGWFENKAKAKKFMKDLAAATKGDYTNIE